jgi:hypothetical protein
MNQRQTGAKSMIGSCTNSGDSWSQPYDSGVDASNSPLWSPVAAGATPGETQSAIDDSSDEDVVLSLGCGSGIDGSPTYSPQGLLNSFVQAGTPLADTSSTGPYGSGNDSGLASSAQSEDGAVLGAEDANGVVGASAYGNYQSLWGNALQTNPGMAGTVAADSLDQGLVGTLSANA